MRMVTLLFVEEFIILLILVSNLEYGYMRHIDAGH